MDRRGARSACRGSRSQASRRRAGRTPWCAGTAPSPTRPNGAARRSPRATSRSGATTPTPGSAPATWPTTRWTPSAAPPHSSARGWASTGTTGTTTPTTPTTPTTSRRSRFAEMIRTAQSLGAHVTPYINGRLWAPAADSYKPDRGCDASCRKPDGTLYTEIYPTSKVLNTVTCPSTDIWHGKIIGLVDRLQRELGVDGIYIDQIAAAAPEPCWNENHPPPGRRRRLLVRRLPASDRQDPRRTPAGGPYSDQRGELGVLHRPVRHAAGGEHAPQCRKLHDPPRFPDGLFRPRHHQRLHLHPALHRPDDQRRLPLRNDQSPSLGGRSRAGWTPATSCRRRPNGRRAS